MCGVPHHAARGYIAKLTELGHKVVHLRADRGPEARQGARQARGRAHRHAGHRARRRRARAEAAALPRRAGRRARRRQGPTPCGLAYLDATTGELARDRAAARRRRRRARARRAARGARRAPTLLADSARPHRSRRCARATARRGTPAPVPSDARGARAPSCGPIASPPSRRSRVDASTRARARARPPTVVAYARATQPTGALPIARLQLYEPGDSGRPRRGRDREPRARRDADRQAHARARCSTSSTRPSTAPGARLLRRWLLYPLVDVAQIRRRQDAVAWLVERPALLRDDPRARSSRIADLERLAGKATLGVATPRDLGRLRDALAQLPELDRARALGRRTSSASCRAARAARSRARARTAALPALAARLAAALVDEPPPLLKDGGVIRAGYDATVDECRRLADGGKDEILAIEEREQKAQRHREPQGPLQPRVRLLHRGHQDAPREGARRTTSASRRSRPASATSPPSSPSSSARC